MPTASPTRKPKPTNSPTSVYPTQFPTIEPHYPTKFPTKKGVYPTEFPTEKSAYLTEFPAKKSVYPTPFPSTAGQLHQDKDKNKKWTKPLPKVDWVKFRKQVCGQSKTYDEAMVTCIRHFMSLCTVDQFYVANAEINGGSLKCENTPQGFYWVTKRESKNPYYKLLFESVKAACETKNDQVKYSYYDESFRCVQRNERSFFACCLEVDPSL